MSSNYAYTRSFIMSFESECEGKSSPTGDARDAINSENRLYAICLEVDEFTLVPALEPSLI